jgi:hypothetical protein
MASWAAIERLIEATGLPAAEKTLPPASFKPHVISDAHQAQPFSDIGMQAVAWPGPFG